MPRWRSSAVLADEQKTGADRNERTAHARLGVDEGAEVGHLVGVRDAVVDDEQPAGGERPQEVGPVGGVEAALGVEEDERTGGVRLIGQDLARVGDDVAFGMENLGVARADIWPRVSDALDAVGLGDDVARSMGVDPFRLRRSTTAVAALGVAAAVAVSGAIGFVGLVVPHLARRLVGATHRALLPAAAMLGALVLVAADALARTVLAPREIPLGILTALVGTPLLMWMMRRRPRPR